MSLDILNNLNPGIEGLHPYEPGRSIDEVAKEFGMNAYDCNFTVISLVNFYQVEK